METLEYPSAQDIREPILPQTNLEVRIEDAIDGCEVLPSPEVYEALTGYYTDHYGLASTIEGAIDGTLDDEAIDKVLQEDNGVVPNRYFNEIIFQATEYGRLPKMPSAESALRLVAHAVRLERLAPEEAKAAAHNAVLRVVGGSLRSTLFQENSLGITTISDTEMDIIEGLSKKLAQAAEISGAKVRLDGEIEWNGSSAIHDAPVRGEYMPGGSELVRRIVEKQESFWDDCRHAGQLEFHNTGFLGDVVNNGGLMPRTEQYRRMGSMNAQMMPERVIMHSVVPHFSELFSLYGYKNEPTSRELEAGAERVSGTVAIPLIRIFDVAPYARDAVYGVVQPVNPELLDRVPVVEGMTNLTVGNDDIPGKEGSDRVFFASPTEKSAQKPDAYKIDLTPDSILILVGSDETSVAYGIGEGMSGLLEIKDEAEAPVRISELQKSILERHWGKICVPLRRGVFDFIPENMPASDKSYRLDPEYNINPTSIRR